MSSIVRPVVIPEASNAPCSRLDREGYVTIEPTGVYQLEYLAEAYPEQIFKAVLKRCPILQEKYVYGANWVQALQKVLGVKEEENDPCSELALLMISEVAKIIQSSADSVERLISTGALKASDLSPVPGAGRAMWRIRRQDLDEFIWKRQSGSSHRPVAQIRPVLTRKPQSE